MNNKSIPKMLLLLLLSAMLSPAVEASAPDPGNPQSKLVREDRVWTYSQKSIEGTQVFDLMFKGTQQINGKEYNNLYYVLEGEELNVETAPVFACLREEDGKVFLHHTFDMRDKFKAAYPNVAYLQYYFTADDEEAMILDINLKQNDSYSFKNYLEPDEEYMYYEKFEVDSVEMWPKENPHLIMQSISRMDPLINQISEFNYIEGIGTPYTLFAFPGSLNPFDNGVYEPELVKLCDLDGNILYPIGGAGIGTEAVADSEATGNPEYFDLFGRRVTAPKAGMFIKVVRMNDGTVRTSKVVVK